MTEQALVVVALASTLQVAQLAVHLEEAHQLSVPLFPGLACSCSCMCTSQSCNFCFYLSWQLLEPVQGQAGHRDALQGPQVASSLAEDSADTQVEAVHTDLAQAAAHSSPAEDPRRRPAVAFRDGQDGRDGRDAASACQASVGASCAEAEVPSEEAAGSRVAAGHAPSTQEDPCQAVAYQGEEHLQPSPRAVQACLPFWLVEGHFPCYQQSQL